MTTPLDAACLGQYIQAFGLRAWRRPVDPTELQRYQAYGTQVGLANPWQALQYVTAAMLTSPNFLYRVELGEADPEHPGWLRYTGYEMAARLSFLLRNTFPDAELFAAAKNGELVTLDGILAQTNRLLGQAAPTAEMIKQLYSEYLDLPLLADVMFPKTMDPNGTIGASMQNEVVGIVNRIALEQPADMRTLFTTPTTFVNPELATLYGLTAPSATAFGQAQLPATGPRAGILTTGALLTLNNRPNRTSPTIRGFFVRQRLLCGTVPPPPPGIPPIQEDDMGAPKTIRAEARSAPRQPDLRSVPQIDGSSRARHGKLRSVRPVPHHVRHRARRSTPAGTSTAWRSTAPRSSAISSPRTSERWSASSSSSTATLRRVSRPSREAIVLADLEDRVRQRRLPAQASLARARGERRLPSSQNGGAMISRRSVLKGVLGGSAFCLGLPLLEQMLNGNGTALAAGTALPKRYGLFFWGNGLPWTLAPPRPERRQLQARSRPIR